MNKKNWKENIAGYLFIAPSLIILCTFIIIPIFYSFGLSFYSWDMLTSGPHLVGLANYTKLFSKDEFYESMGRTIWYSLMTVPCSMILGLVIAVALDQKLRFMFFYRSIFFTPLVTSTVAISVVWMWIYHPDYGFLNAVLGGLGIPPMRWLNDPHMSLLSLAIMGIWKSLGFSVVIYLAGLQNIPNHYIEAAQVDGANAWQIFYRIRIPLLTPTIFLLLIILTIEQFQTFTQVNVMTKGGPANSTELIVIMLWHYAFELFQMGYASAIAVVLFVVILSLTLLQMWVVGRKVHYE